MLRYERIRRFRALKYLIVKWTNQEDLSKFIDLLKESEGDGDVINRIQRDSFKSVNAIELIRFYLELEHTQGLDNQWLTKDEIEECNQRALSIYKDRLDASDWGSVTE